MTDRILRCKMSDYDQLKFKLFLKRRYDIGAWPLLPKKKRTIFIFFSSALARHFYEAYIFCSQHRTVARISINRLTFYNISWRYLTDNTALSYPTFSPNTPSHKYVGKLESVLCLRMVCTLTFKICLKASLEIMLRMVPTLRHKSLSDSFSWDWHILVFGWSVIIDRYLLFLVFLVKGPATDATDAPQLGGLLCKYCFSV
jgi:hypothetical protein